MALLTSHSNANKVLEELPKNINIFLDASAAVGGGVLIYFNSTHTERFKYVGMTQAAAAACQAAMIAQYTEIVNGVGQCVADVSATRQDGHMWQVSVSVMRTAVTVQFQPPA